MAQRPDYSILDEPELLRFVFYPRREWTQAPDGSSDHFVPVAEGISISCRFYRCGRSAPTILFYHGNGEVACDYDGIAPVYNSLGIDLFVADYRGYGASGGSPSFSHVMADAHAIFRYVRRDVVSQDGSLFLMGRSLGSYSAVELATHYPDGISGLIMESGFANIARLLRRFGFPMQEHGFSELAQAGLARIRSLTLPVLILHGAADTLVPPSEAHSFYQEVGSVDKRIVTIPGAGHNDIMLVGMAPYFAAIKDFVFRLSTPATRR